MAQTMFFLAYKLPGEGWSVFWWEATLDGAVRAAQHFLPVLFSAGDFEFVMSGEHNLALYQFYKTKNGIQMS